MEPNIDMGRYGIRWINKSNGYDTAGHDDLQFHVLCFEGPDDYARAGGIATRISGLTQALADAGFETHLWFVGDPHRPGHEACGRLNLHRWCQWISRYHPEGVYAGEEGKHADYAESLPPFLMREVLRPHLRRPGARAVILAEEWQTVDAVVHLDRLLRQAGLRQRATMLWNANNTFSFDRVNWSALSRAAVITTVSRYMKHLMRRWGVEALVVPNGLSAEALEVPEREAIREFRRQFRDRMVLSKVARWDPDKRWLLAIETVGELKRHGWRPLLIARGGVEAHGGEVLAAAAAHGLRVAERTSPGPGVRGMLQALEGVHGADVVNLRSPIDAESRRVLFRGSSAVLANSGHEPFGLVGLEAMAAGGIACTGCSGEDYVVPGHNALVLETDNPFELLGLLEGLRANPTQERALRRAGRLTAQRFVWPNIIERVLLPRLRLLGAHE